jgi:hypothetical protein
MLVACRLAGISALGVHYAGVKSRAMLGEAQRVAIHLCGARRISGLSNFNRWGRNA